MLMHDFSINFKTGFWLFDWKVAWYPTICVKVIIYFNSYQTNMFWPEKRFKLVVLKNQNNVFPSILSSTEAPLFSKPTFSEKKLS